MKNKKTLLLVVLALLLVFATIGGTLAYLTSQDEVTNTFTIGKVEISLHEHKTNAAGKFLAGEEVVNDAAQADVINTAENTEVGNQYHLIPGSTYNKDPYVVLKANSEACWLFVKVENGITSIESTQNGYTNIVGQITTTNGWTKLDGETDVYYKYIGAKTGNEDAKYQIFSSFDVDPFMNNADFVGMDSAEIAITAYAIQAENVSVDNSQTGAAKAWELLAAQIAHDNT